MVKLGPYRGQGMCHEHVDGEPNDNQMKVNLHHSMIIFTSRISMIGWQR
jgi:hypothetical protein